MPKKIDVYGLNREELVALRKIAATRYGKASVSLLARKLLQELLEEKPEPAVEAFPQMPAKKRITLRLPDRDCAYLMSVSEQNRSSINDTVRVIIQTHIHKTPFISKHETDALYRSNYQLLRIGRNLNQIARQLNAGENMSLTSRQIKELKAFIDVHTDRVNQVLQTQRKRHK